MSKGIKPTKKLKIYSQQMRSIIMLIERETSPKAKKKIKTQQACNNFHYNQEEKFQQFDKNAQCTSNRKNNDIVC